MREYKVSAEMLPYVVKVLNRDSISYEIGNNTIKVPLSGNKFHIVVEDAACELERKDIPVYSMRTIMNKKKFKRLRQLNNCNAFHVLQRDQELFLNSCCA